ncbi:hypothetical protein OKA05_17410 [Luteolibacter arcticus]|uniref:Beta-lactamase-related domain-containing protein n=1 Tax=Luteolibacter arcticus TaxID=1581411 RepID=A0ABT3GLF2_9BACT|nr:hypothetical protein [Luteolibacter arcticus]MCW1924348.1 hypothetical protein [Luteolibacter arcticus]
MPWRLRWFPAWVPAISKREYPSIGETRDRWNVKTDVDITEREWPGLASLTLRAGMTAAAFYGESVPALRNGLRDSLEKLARKEGTKAGSAITYNGAHAVVGRIGIFSTTHPHNESFRTFLDAVLHDDGEISAAVTIRRPWQSGSTAFAPGIFEAIDTYLSRHDTTLRH